jgi:hypothetical protein
MHYLFTRKKTVLTNLFGAELQGKGILLTYNGEKIILYSDYGEELHVFYSVPAHPIQFAGLVDCQDVSTVNFSQQVSMDTAARIVKLTWNKRLLPPRIEPAFMAMLVMMAGISMIELVYGVFMLAYGFVK